MITEQKPEKMYETYLVCTTECVCACVYFLGSLPYDYSVQEQFSDSSLGMISLCAHLQKNKLKIFRA